MKIRLNSQSVLILVLVFVGSLSASSLVPMMGLFIVEGLEQQPWKISIYSAVVTVLTLAVNRIFGEWLDRGTNVSRLLLISILCFLTGTFSLSLFPSYMLLVTCGALFLGLSNTALSTTFTFGRLHSERTGLDVVVYNSWLRIHSSLGWMVGPALSFTVIGIWGFSTTLLMSAGIGCIWLLIWYLRCSGITYRRRSRKRSRPDLQARIAC
ncbi:MAG: hypothetical protein GY789_19910 [Hyphomicrobiales bacterium]|nr:hypothetical protein [Hyphomicrobiales bacterium]MCP4999775.1 hypothetical protein [Hyphomicrobiales bacterium]